jgi:hypothetical protein
MKLRELIEELQAAESEVPKFSNLDVKIWDNPISMPIEGVSVVKDTKGNLCVHVDTRRSFVRRNKPTEAK